MIKDLNKVYRDINEIYSNITYSLDHLASTDNKKVFSTRIESPYFKGNANVTGIIESEGALRVYFTFGEVEESAKLLKLINEFNAFAMWAKAYVGELNGRKRLEVRYTNALELDDDQAVVLFRHFFDDILSDGLVGHLTPMVALTK